jgi:hypothetical protein
VRDVRDWLLGVCGYRVSVEWRVIVMEDRHNGGYVVVCNMTEVCIVIVLVLKEPVSHSHIAEYCLIISLQGLIRNNLS